MQNNYEISNDQLLAEAKVSQPFDTQQTLDTLSTASRGPAGLGVITEASPGTQIVRDGNRLNVEGKQALIAGDRVVVPKGGFANVVMPGRQPGETPLSGTFTGGTEALVNVKPGTAGAADQLQVELVSGDMIVTGADDMAKATTLAVKKPGSAGESAGWLLPLALGGLLGALADSGSDDDGNDNGNQTPTTPTIPTTPIVPTSPTNPTNPTTPTNPINPTTPTVPSQGLLDPTNTLVNNLTNALGDATSTAPGLSGVLDVLNNAAAPVTSAGNGALGPLLGMDFNSASPNQLDPVDTAVSQLTMPLGGLLGDILDPALGQGAVATLIAPLNTQIDFVTDGAATLLGGGTGNSLLGLTTNDITPAGNGLLDPAEALVDTLTDGLDGALLGALGLNGILDPVDTLVGAVSILGNNVTTPLLGQTFATNDSNSLDPVDGLIDEVTNGLSEPLAALLDPLAGQGTVESVVDLLDIQVDFVTDGLVNLLGDTNSGSNLRDILGFGQTDSTTDGTGLLDPASTLVDQLTDGLDNNLLDSLQLSGVLNPVDSAVNTVTDLANEVLSPLLGSKFVDGNMNAFEPLDTLVDTLVDGLGTPLDAVLTPLLGEGTTELVVVGVAQEVDFVTDGLNTLLGGLAGSDLPLSNLPLTNLPIGNLPLSGDALPGIEAFGPLGSLLTGARLF